MLHSCNHYQVPELLHHPHKETSYPLSSHSQLSTSPQFLATTNLPSICVCCCSVTKPRPTLCNPMDCSMPGFPVLLMSIESMMPPNHLILCRPLLFLSSIFPSIRLFYNESALPIRWPKYWSFSVSLSPSNEYLGMISFRIGWLDFPSLDIP